MYTCVLCTFSCYTAYSSILTMTSKYSSILTMTSKYSSILTMTSKLSQSAAEPLSDPPTIAAYSRSPPPTKIISPKLKILLVHKRFLRSLTYPPAGSDHAVLISRIGVWPIKAHRKITSYIKCWNLKAFCRHSRGCLFQEVASDGGSKPLACVSKAKGEGMHKNCESVVGV